MKREIRVLCGTLVFAVLQGQVQAANSEYQKYSTEFLAPKGVWAVDVNFINASVSSRYDRDGNKQPLLNALPAPLDSELFPLLPPLASLGTVSGNLKYRTRVTDVTAGYGFTDDLSAGFKIPFGESCSDVSLSVAPGNVGFTSTGGIAPVGAGGLPLDDAGLNALLTSQFGYTQVGSNCVDGVYGATAGVAWRAYDGQYDSLILLPGIRFGSLDDQHDPDNLFQPIIDDGSNDIILRADYYRDLRNSLDLVVQFEYDIQLEDKQTMRIPNSTLPLASSKEKLKRDLGDYFIFDVELGYRFWQDQLRIFAAYYHRNKDGDKYSSPTGRSTQFLEQGTTLVDHEIRAGIYYDGVPAWRQGKLPLPLRLELNHWKSTGGQNNLKFHFTEFHVTFAF